MLHVREAFPRIPPLYSPQYSQFPSLLNFPPNTYFHLEGYIYPFFCVLFVFLPEVIHSLNKYLFSTHYVPGTVLSPRNMAVSRSDQSP